MPIHYLITATVLTGALLAALLSRRSAIALPAAVVAAADGAVLTGLCVGARLYLPAGITLVGTLGALLVGADHLKPATITTGRVPGTCPSWCEIEHPSPGPHQRMLSHERVMGAQDLSDGGITEVRITWMEHLSGLAGDPPVIVLSVYGNHATDVELTPEQAAVISIVLAANLSHHLGYAHGIALSGDAGWLPAALAEAARALGYRPAPALGGAV